MTKKRLKTLGANAAMLDEIGAAAVEDMETVENPARASPPAASLKTKVSVAIVGFASVRQRSAHGEAELRRAASEAVGIGHRAWKWKPTNLTIQFHTSQRTMGFARGAGTGHRTGITVVSLSKRLIAEYDLNSIRRTLIHELCHHYREERFAITPEVRKTKGHDSVFCRELGRADKTLNKDAHTCRYFSEERIRRDIDRKVKWSPSSGELLYMKKRGRGSLLFWSPKKAGAWVPVEFILNDAEILELSQKFKASEWKHVTLRYTGGTVPTLDALLVWVSGRPKHFPRVTEMYARSRTKRRGSKKAKKTKKSARSR